MRARNHAFKQAHLLRSGNRHGIPPRQVEAQALLPGACLGERLLAHGTLLVQSGQRRAQARVARARHVQRRREPRRLGRR